MKSYRYIWILLILSTSNLAFYGCKKTIDEPAENIPPTDFKYIITRTNHYFGTDLTNYSLFSYEGEKLVKINTYDGFDNNLVEQHFVTYEEQKATVEHYIYSSMVSKKIVAFIGENVSKITFLKPVAEVLKEKEKRIYSYSGNQLAESIVFYNGDTMPDTRAVYVYDDNRIANINFYHPDLYDQNVWTYANTEISEVIHNYQYLESGWKVNYKDRCLYSGNNIIVENYHMDFEGNWGKSSEIIVTLDDSGRTTRITWKNESYEDFSLEFVYGADKCNYYDVMLYPEYIFAPFLMDRERSLYMLYYVVD